jgi:hypothetical protein
MAQYDVTHIDIGRYRELRRLVLEGRAKALIVVDYLDAEAPPALREMTMDGGAAPSSPLPA